MSYIDVRIEFSEEVEDFGNDETYTHYNPENVYVVSSDISDEDRRTIAESAGQSDQYTIGVANAVLSSLGDTSKYDVKPF